MDELLAFFEAQLAEDEAVAREASGGTVVGEPRHWRPAPGGDEWAVHADIADGDVGPDGDLEVLVALRPGLPVPPAMQSGDPGYGYWGSVISWRSEGYRDEHAPVPQFRHMARHDPHGALLDVAADRKLLSELRAAMRDRGSELDFGFASGLRLAVKIRASRFRDKPGYLAEWAP